MPSQQTPKLGPSSLEVESNSLESRHTVTVAGEQSVGLTLRSPLLMDPSSMWDGIITPMIPITELDLHDPPAPPLDVVLALVPLFFAVCLTNLEIEAPFPSPECRFNRHTAACPANRRRAPCPASSFPWIRSPRTFCFPNLEGSHRDLAYSAPLPELPLIP